MDPRNCESGKYRYIWRLFCSFFSIAMFDDQHVDSFHSGQIILTLRKKTLGVVSFRVRSLFAVISPDPTSRPRCNVDTRCLAVAAKTHQLSDKTSINIIIFHLFSMIMFSKNGGIWNMEKMVELFSSFHDLLVLNVGNFREWSTG